MRLVSFTVAGSARAETVGVLSGESVVDLGSASGGDPKFRSMLGLAEAGSSALTEVESIVRDVLAAVPGTEGALYDKADVVIIAPIPRPKKNVFCVGLNYRSHVEENAAALGLAAELPSVPLFFSKPTTAVVGPDDGIVLDDRLTAKLDYEVELAVVLGKGGSWIGEDEAADYILGYTLVNDISARDLQWRTTQMFYGKGLDTFCPMGPSIATPEEFATPDEIVLELRVNGEVRQREASGNMIFSAQAVIAELSKGITLEAGDVISLGTPGGCGYQMVPPRFLRVGDVVECIAPRIGTLRNTIISPM